MTDFTQKFLSAIIQLDPSASGTAPANTYETLTNHRIVCDINDTGGQAQGEARIKIYGLPDSLINSMTVVGSLMNQIRVKNRITIMAGDDPNAMSTIYTGTIFEAYGDFNSAPDVALEITAYSAMGAAIVPAAASSYKGATSVAFIMQQLAQNQSWGFENSGVNVTLMNPYYIGSTLDQVKECARDANIDATVELDVLKIKPKFGSYNSKLPTPIISPSTGMVGYPTCSSSGLFIKTLFNPNIHLGNQITVQESAVEAANGTWTVNQVSHELESRVPNGRWFTNIGVFADGKGSGNV